MSDEKERRQTDPLIIEMHGMVQRLDQKMDDTQKWITTQGGLIETLENRVKPLEQFQETVQTATKWTLASIPVLGGVIASAWAGLKWAIKHSGQ